jgi:hypothetical protein
MDILFLIYIKTYITKSDSFESYDPLFEGYLKNNIKSSNKVEVVVYNPYIMNYPTIKI